MALDYYATSPFGSLARIEDNDIRLWYTHWALHSPKNIQEMLFSRQTGAFIQGVAKHFSLSEEGSQQVAFAALRAAIGEISLPDLGGVLAAELGVPLTKAQAIGKEIEKELLVPYMLEYNQWMKELHQKAEGWEKKQAQRGVQNVINLKENRNKENGK